MAGEGKPIVWLHGEIRTPPFSREARIEAGVLLRRLQNGESIGLPHSRPMSVIGARVHELRVRDEDLNWRVIYRIDADAIVVLEVFSKKSQQTAKGVIRTCQSRLRRYDELA